MFACEIAHNMPRAYFVFPGVFLSMLIACLVPCPAASAQAPTAVEDPYVAPHDRALLVLARPRQRQSSETELRVVNQAGGCLGLLRNGWQVAVPMWPGRHMLMVVTGTAPPTVQLLEVKVSAGKTYVVKLRTRVNVKSPVDIQIVRRSDQPLEQFPQDIKAIAPFEQDLRSCTEWVSWKRSKLEAKAQAAKAKWDDADEALRDELTVRRNDGWTSAEVTGGSL